MQNYCIYLKPKSSFISWPASDTLFGAICWAIWHFYGEKELEEKLKTWWESKPEFILSSSFPCLVKNGNRVRFFPKPLIPDLTTDEINNFAGGLSKNKDPKSLEFKSKVVNVVEKAKELKKINYVSEKIFEEIIKGEVDTGKLFERLKKKGAVPQDIEKIGNVLITTGERQQIDPDGELKCIFGEVDVQRNQIDRVAGATVEGLLFFNKETFLQRDLTQLWFLIKTDNIDFLRPLFRYLEDTGIGGERTSGKGHFEIKLDETDLYQLPEVKDANTFVTLSRYFPDEDERDFTNGYASWNLVSLRHRRETIHSPSGKFISNELLRMFTEGSIFPLKHKKEYYGKLEIITFKDSKYSIYRNGFAFPVFAKIGEKR